MTLTLLAGFAASPRPCRADDRGPSTNAWTVSRSPEASSCPDAAALRAAVDRAEGDVGAGGPPRRDAPLDVAFARDGAGYTATIRVRGAGDQVRTLTDPGPSCAGLAQAVVTASIVLLDHLADEAEPSPAPPPPPPPAASPTAAASANEAGVATDDPSAYEALRISVTAHAGLAHYHRSSTSPRSETGVALGGEVRIHPHSRHGFVAGAMTGGAIFGPTVTILDAAYSLALVEQRPLNGVSGLVYLELGPSFGIVSDAPPAADHSVLGARASFVLDAAFSNVTLGFSAGYRGGVPLRGTPDPWEGAFTVLLRAGVVLDFDKRPRPAI